MKILMVCLGNICRSPLAEGILKSKSKNIYVDSAGTAGYHIGKKPDSRSVEIGLKHNIDITDQRARQFNSDDFSEFDKIYVILYFLYLPKGRTKESLGRNGKRNRASTRDTTFLSNGLAGTP